MLVVHILRVLVIIAVCQLFVFLIHVIRTKRYNFPRFVLGAIFFCFAIFLSGYAFLFFFNEVLFGIAQFANLFIFLSAPLLFLYFLSFVEGKSNINGRDIVHFIPFFVAVSITSYNIIFYPEQLFRYYNIGITLLSLLFLQNILYLIILTVKLHKRDILLFRSKIKSIKTEFQWITKLIRIFFVIIILQLCIFLTRDILKLEICIVLTGIFFVFTFLVVNSMVLMGLSKSRLFDYEQKYKSSPINKELKGEYYQKICQVFYRDEMYLDPLITLDKLARNIHVPMNSISQVINETFKMNFKSLINKLRIEKAVELISESNGDAKIIDIAYEIGFSSKSTFNTAFKKYIGLTPSEYIAQSNIKKS